MDTTPLLKNFEKTLSLKLIEFFQETHTSFLYKTKYKGQDSILKIFREDSDEKENPFLFKYFNEEIRPKIFFVNGDAILMESLYPGNDLSKLDKSNSKEALEIFCNLVKKLNRPHQDIKNVKDVSHFIKNFDTATNNLNDLLFKEHIKYAKNIYKHLIETQGDRYLLHGDLHHYNILNSGNQWKMIDPKCFIGELEYEVSAFIKNPIDYPEVYSTEANIKMRAEYISKELKLSAKRIIHWAYANTVLSLTYLKENDDKRDPWMKLANILRKIL